MELAVSRLVELDRSRGLAIVESFRSDVTNVLSNTHPPKQNITKRRESTSRHLQKEKILPADKGKLPVIIDVDSYKHKIRVML